MAIEQGHLADLLHQLGAARLDQLVEHGRAVVAVGQGELDLDQLVVAQGPVEFGDHPLGGAVLGDRDHGVEMVADAAKCFLLCL